MTKDCVDATVVIPTFNRKSALLQTLDCLNRCDYPGTLWEVLVVDDGSTDGTVAAVEDWIRGSRAPVRLISQENKGPASARNRGAAQARGANLIFIDNDILVGPGFIAGHLKSLSLHQGSWIIGRVVNMDQLRITPFGRYRDSIWESYYQSLSASAVQEASGLTAANLSLPAGDFQRLGGFDESFTIASCEDWELGVRARQAGIEILYDPSIVARHNDWAISMDRFCERQTLYSISDVLLFQKYADDSPRAPLVRRNSPIRWKSDSVRLIAAKSLKRLLALRPFRRAIRLSCRLIERLAPDTALNRRAYDLAVALAIFHGVRQGLSRYSTRTDLAGKKRTGLVELPADQRAGQ